MGNLRTVLAASAVALLLAACTDAAVEHSESASPSASVSVSASATASPSPGRELTTEELLALLPPGAELPDVQGAIVTAEFFVELYGEMLRTGDTRIWDALSGPECEFCANGSKTVAEFRDGGIEIVGGSVSVEQGKSRGRLNDDGFTYVGVIARQEAITTMQISTGETHTFEPDHFGVALKMEFNGTTWTMVGGQVTSPEEIQ